MTETFRVFNPIAIRAGLAGDTRSVLRQLTVLEVVDSTNQFLQRFPLAERHGHAVVAERQESGRGRRGRSWYSPPGGNIYLSLGWKLPAPADGVRQLPLAVAVCVARAMQRAGVGGAGIKWPNDILVDGRKLAGILLEACPDGFDGVVAVIGVGINVRMPSASPMLNPIEQAWTDLCSQLPQPPAEDFRDGFCGLVLDELLRGLQLFESQSFTAFAAEWDRLDILRGRLVHIKGEQETAVGTAAGISTRGGLLVCCSGPCGEETVREFLAGDVSIRLP